jgi:hypothetical protein
VYFVQQKVVGVFVRFFVRAAFKEQYAETTALLAEITKQSYMV